MSNEPAQAEFDGMEIPRDELVSMAAEQAARVAFLDTEKARVSGLHKAEKQRLDQMNAALYRSVELPEFHLTLGDFTPKTDDGDAGAAELDGEDQ